MVAVEGKTMIVEAAFDEDFISLLFSALSAISALVFLIIDNACKIFLKK